MVERFNQEMTSAAQPHQKLELELCEITHKLDMALPSLQQRTNAPGIKIQCLWHAGCHIVFVLYLKKLGSLFPWL